MCQTCITETGVDIRTPQIHTIEVSRLSIILYKYALYHYTCIELRESDLLGQAMLPAWIGPGGRWPLLACLPVRCHLRICCTCAPPPHSQPVPPAHTALQVNTGALICRIATTKRLLLLPMACMQPYLPVTNVCRSARSTCYLPTGCTCVLAAGAATCVLHFYRLLKWPAVTVAKLQRPEQRVAWHGQTSASFWVREFPVITQV